MSTPFLSSHALSFEQGRRDLVAHILDSYRLHVDIVPDMGRCATCDAWSENAVVSRDLSDHPCCPRFSAVIAAAACGHIDVLEDLIKRGARLDLPDSVRKDFVQWFSHSSATIFTVSLFERKCCR